MTGRNILDKGFRGTVLPCPPNLNGLPSRTHTPSVGSLSQSACALSSSFAFTLAEVLITLAIIGVVAALTIPTVVRNYQKQQTAVQLKKVYSTLSNAANLAIAEHGPISEWVIGETYSSEAVKAFVNTYVAPYLKVQKNCGTTINVCSKVYRTHPSGNLQNWYRMGSNRDNFAKLLLDDGTLLWFCNWENRDVAVYVDINGDKPPNQWGRDAFAFTYNKQNNSFPNFVKTTRDALIERCSGEKTLDGMILHCASLIARDGWQIRDDYPW